MPSTVPPELEAVQILHTCNDHVFILTYMTGDCIAPQFCTQVDLCDRHVGLLLYSLVPMQALPKSLETKCQIDQ